MIIGLLEVDHLMAFAQGKQGHTYNITDEEMEEARGTFGKGKGRKRKRGHFEISEEHLPFGVPLIDLLVQDGYHEN